MATERIKIGEAKASPTKDFFVKMLTRDIDLQDALLDLLDNCVDGIVRSGATADDKPKPYKDYRATITLCKDHFSIEDNCGGIPYEIAVKSAFAMGRPPGTAELTSHATVGMYGIGMKRAIFKLGTEALVESRHDKAFTVEFSSKWMSSDDWTNLPMYGLSDEKIPKGVTRIVVYKLNDEVAACFDDKDWVDDFRKAVAQHYSIILSKGFSVAVGSPDELAEGKGLILPDVFQLLNSGKREDGTAIAPYVYVGKIGGVAVEIYAGLYRELTKQELESEESTRGSFDEAGWTVACNDRVVIWKDKTKLTGWGEATVPNYHGQFIAITGIVLLQSDHPKELPLTTTKRGIDAASNVYLDVKDLMREATKNLTAFTNRWKKFPDQLEEIYKGTEYVDLPKLRAQAAEAANATIRKLPDFKKSDPQYPVPPQEKTSTRVSFVALKKDVELLANHFFDDVKTKPGIVGEAAFNQVLEDTRK
ncbi:ATP-binding protein [Agrobacterium cavarae]|uniref:ATP-binding protein n=1 Tax=Agrobacterium cavarae TaxID=2528239 RepID=UPI00289FC764|nr:ATP-binding protein [Agrobacterium cavarae]